MSDPNANFIENHGRAEGSYTQPDLWDDQVTAAQQYWAAHRSVGESAYPLVEARTVPMTRSASQEEAWHTRGELCEKCFKPGEHDRTACQFVLLDPRFR